ncbi:plastid division1 [Tasmannia lanceolata]|uniref:plastid division1 n=1 Tax=Tasmannia lanceolata TaxID=3420 RepID=UPI0040647C1A
MEMEENLHILIERVYALHDRVTDEIQHTCIGLGGFYPQHNQYGRFAEDPFAERRSLSAISNGLEDLENLLLFLQRLQSRHQTEQHAALIQLEESRLFLIKKMTEHPGRAPEVIQDMLRFVGNKNNLVNQDANDHFPEKVDCTLRNIPTKKKRRGIMAYLNSCLQIFSYPWKLQNVVGTVTRFVVVVASMVSFIQLYQSRQIRLPHGRKDHSLLNSTGGKMGYLQHISNSPLDVFYGRG